MFLFFSLVEGSNKQRINNMKHPASNHFQPMQNFSNTLENLERCGLRAEIIRVLYTKVLYKLIQTKQTIYVIC